MGSTSTEIAPAHAYKSKAAQYVSWEEDMKRAFDEVDTDHSGELEPSELMELMKKVRCASPSAAA